MKRKLAMILAALMMFSILPMNAFAAPNDKLIALTFDDGPSAYTKRLLDGLRQRGVKCTFFVVGSYANIRPELIKQMWLDGHQVASHTYDHPYLTELSDANIRSQLDRTDAVLDKAIGFDQDYMLRPPYGDFNDRVLKTANVPCFYWSMDTLDWKLQSTQPVYENFLKYAKDGSLALLHDSHSTSVDAALMAVDYYLARGYEFVTVSEMFYRRGVNLQNGKIYYYAYPDSYGTADKIAEPVISSVNTDAGKQVTIQGDSRGSVYYTTNGEYPTPVNSKLYSGPFTVEQTTTVKAVSVINGKWNGLRSDVTTTEVKYTPAPTPVIRFEDGIVSISCDNANADIYYTVDGTSPDKSSIRYMESFDAVPGTTYRARSYAPSFDASVVSMLTYSDLGNLFSDVATDTWCYKYVDRCVDEGLFYGYDDLSFRPDAKFTRAMLVSVLYRIAGSPDIEGLAMPFNDVSEAYWAYKPIVWAANNGVINGYDDGSFRPANNLSRQAMCMMLANYMSFAGKDVSGVALAGLDKYSDADQVSAPMTAAVDLISSLGIVNGYNDGTLRPQNSANRGQAAVMLLRMSDTMALLPDLVVEPEPIVDPEPVVE